MPAVRQRIDVAAPEGIFYGWLAAALAFPLTLVLAASSQGVAALVGGCGWIGISLPMDRQVWALVDQPALNFASEARALGYWLASSVVPLLFGLGSISLLPRARSLAAELLFLHGAWAATAVGVAWLPLLDPGDGHLTRWLALGGLPWWLVWLAPVLAAPAAVPATLRLLALARSARQHAGRWFRLAVVGLHLAAPCAAWCCVVWALRGEAAIAPSLALLAPLATAGAIAWIGYPAPFVHRLRPLNPASWLRLAALATVMAALLLAAGRPMPGDRRAGLVWSQPGENNNIRPWIATAPLWRTWSPSDTPHAD
jgi:hypothetical protein